MVNGRKTADLTRAFTFITSNGTSLTDYVIASDIASSRLYESALDLVVES